VEWFALLFNETETRRVCEHLEVVEEVGEEEEEEEEIDRLNLAPFFPSLSSAPGMAWWEFPGVSQ